MPLNFALNSDFHPKSAPTALSCVSRGCLLVLYFRGADLTLCAGPDVTLPGGIPWPGCRMMFLRTFKPLQNPKRNTKLKTWPTLPQGHSFPWEKSWDWRGTIAHFVWLRAGGWHFYKQESLMEPELLLKPSLHGQVWLWSGYSEDFWGKARQWGFLKDFGSPVYSSDFLLEVFGGLCITLKIKDRLTWA